MDKEFVGCILGVVAIIGMFMFGIYCFEKKSCYSKYVDFQPEYHGVITGCLVQYNGKTVPIESLRVME